ASAHKSALDQSFPRFLIDAWRCGGGILSKSVSPERADADVGPSIPASSLFQKKAENTIHHTSRRSPESRLTRSATGRSLFDSVVQWNAIRFDWTFGCHVESRSGKLRRSEPVEKRTPR